MLFAITTTYAQFQPDYYLAQEAVESAREEAATVLATPQLIMIGSRSMYIEEMDLDMKFDFNNGKSNAWIYLFRDSADHTKLAGVFMMKYMVVFVPFLVEQDQLELDSNEININVTLDDYSWINSDEAALEFKKCEDFQEFISTYPTPDSTEVGLFPNSDYEYLQENEPYWTIRVTEKFENVVADVHAVNKELHCRFFTSVLDNIDIKPNIDLSVNGNNIVLRNISIGEDAVELSIYSLEGSLLFEESISNVSGDVARYFPFDSFSSGSYIVVAKSGKSFGMTKVSVLK